MISFAWLDKLLNINNNPAKIQFFDSNGEEGVVISKRLLRDKISEAYEAGASDQEYLHGTDENHRDSYVKEVMKDYEQVRT